MVGRRQAPRRDRGAVAVEFALVMPVLLLVLFSMVDLGRAFFVKNGLDRAASVGAQTLAIRATNPNQTTAAGATGACLLPVTDTSTTSQINTAECVAQTAGQNAQIVGMSGSSTFTNPSVTFATKPTACPPDVSGLPSESYTAVATVTMAIDFKWLSPLPTFGTPGGSRTITASASWLCVFTNLG